ncbi:hypothetical protein ACQP1G_37490 [Nocardia sp. CA-107356]|uniref:hypothetical protein n=1 Tax=Nocardia sp. CA-107356 TaxID=3239972 RepID=UPI003D93D885
MTIASHTAIAVTPMLTDIAALAELIDTDPCRARQQFRQALKTLTPADWGFLGLIHRGFANSPETALARVVSITNARIGIPDNGSAPCTDPDERLYALADAIEIPVEVELGPWARTPVREPGHDLRLHATPSTTTDARRETPEAVAARRARHTPHPLGPSVLRHRARDERAAQRRRRAEADADAYFAQRPPLVA